jgi:hypothetical protein
MTDWQSRYDGLRSLVIRLLDTEAMYAAMYREHASTRDTARREELARALPDGFALIEAMRDDLRRASDYPAKPEQRRWWQATRTPPRAPAHPEGAPKGRSVAMPEGQREFWGDRIMRACRALRDADRSGDASKCAAAARNVCDLMDEWDRETQEMRERIARTPPRD